MLCWNSFCRNSFAGLLLGAAFVATVAHAADADAIAQAQALFVDYWDWVLQESPTYGPSVGDDRFPDRLDDLSAAAVRTRNAGLARFAARAASIDAALLPAADRTSLRVLRDELDRDLTLTRLYGDLPFGANDSWAPVTQLEGIHLDLPELARVVRTQDVADYEHWLQRLAAVPSTVDAIVDRMRRAIDAGWMPPRVAIQRVPQQIDAQLDPDPHKSPEFEPFTRFPDRIPAAERERLTRAAERVILDKVIPAFASLKAFFEATYLPAASELPGASHLPGGLAYYQAQLSRQTTTDMTPLEIHQLGLREVARIGRQMDAIAAATGFTGSRAEFQVFLNQDPSFFFERAEDMLAGYRDIAKRADAALPALFAQLPRQAYGVRAMRPEEGDNAEYYTAGAADGSRPGWFEANVNDLRTRPKWTMETLLLHEAVPGHHLQSARAQEMTALPAFRRHAWVAAYGEGWALYAESLGDQMGMYRDPYQRFGHLSYEMLRASRLVVDTGLHAFGWRREQAIDYMVENTGLTPADMAAEVDRYLVWPGQAAAYKIGAMRIQALRDHAKAELGDRFDLRRFHNALIDGGSMPLDVLDQEIGDWIAAERAHDP